MSSDPNNEARERATRSEQLLQAHSVPINPGLPLIETSDETNLRTPPEIAHRAVCLLIVAASTSIPRDIISGLIEEFGVAEHFSPEENAFLANPKPSKHDTTQFTWRVEAAYPLFWALGYLPKLGLPLEQAMADPLIEIADSHGMDGLIENATPRSNSEVLDEVDLIYRAHWAVRDAELNPDQPSVNLERGVTIERHQALNWLIRYEDNAEWDDVPTDT